LPARVRLLPNREDRCREGTRFHLETPTPRRFAILIVDEDDPRGTTAHLCADPELWAWLQREESFPDGVEYIESPIPGTDLLAHVTRWEPLTDKAQNLVWLPGGRGRSHPVLTPVELEINGAATDLDELRGRLAAEGASIVEARW
jgi:hypothetical protein